jgi:hypothetical protein
MPDNSCHLFPFCLQNLELSVDFYFCIAKGGSLLFQVCVVFNLLNPSGFALVLVFTLMLMCGRLEAISHNSFL